MTFDRCDEPADWALTDIDGLRETVVAALCDHFSSWDQAAEAQQDCGRVEAEIENDPSMTLFGVDEAWRAGLDANPKAREWAAFQHQAAARIAPFCVSIRFTVI